MQWHDANCSPQIRRRPGHADMTAARAKALKPKTFQRGDHTFARNLGSFGIRISASNAKLWAYQFQEGQIVFSGRRQTV
jgi:hypothetical protein